MRRRWPVPVRTSSPTGSGFTSGDLDRGRLVRRSSAVRGQTSSNRTIGAVFTVDPPEREPEEKKMVPAGRRDVRHSLALRPEVRSLYAPGQEMVARRCDTVTK